jgi:Glycosyl hydrolase family 26
VRGFLRRWSGAASAIGLALAAGVVIVAAVVALDGPPQRRAEPAGAPVEPVPAVGKSCIYTRNSVAAIEEIGTLMGRSFDCASLYNNTAESWSDLETPWFVRSTDSDHAWPQWVRAAPGRRLAIGQAMIPRAEATGNWRERGANGDFDAHITTLGRNLVAAGLGDAIIRLAPEANGDWHHDNVGADADDFAAWRKFWARWVKTMRAVPGARFTFDWNLNAGFRALPLEAIYPGDDVVDIVGLDVYDRAGQPLPDPQTEARWTAIASQPGGVAEIVSFARARGKPLSIPEWGLQAGEDGGGGDNSRFVEAVADLVADQPVVYQSYFNNPLLGGCLAIETQPEAFAAYRRAFGSG